MKAIRIHDYAGELVWEDAPQPEIGDNQVLVEIYATSVNHLEVMMASGNHKDIMPVEFPWIPGFDFAGRIDYVGPGITGFNKGDEVYGKCSGGTYAEYMAADMGTFAPMPANLSFSEAATVPHVGLTAWEAVFKYGKIEPGANVLIHGASGGVGAFAVQFAKLAGGFVYAVDKAENTGFLTSIGADAVIDFKTVDFTHVVKDIDLVLDFVGGDTPVRSYQVMKKGGTLVTTVASIDTKEAEYAGVHAAGMWVGPDLESLSEITQLIEQGRVRTDLAEVYPLAEAAKAWDVYNHKAKPDKEYTHGKIVLVIK